MKEKNMKNSNCDATITPKKITEYKEKREKEKKEYIKNGGKVTFFPKAFIDTVNISNKMLYFCPKGDFHDTKNIVREEEYVNQYYTLRKTVIHYKCSKCGTVYKKEFTKEIR